MFGVDHLIAIVVVGTLAYLLRDRLAWFTLPATFVGAMAIGGTLGVLGVTTSSTELFVALSVVLLGVVLVALTGVIDTRALAVLVARPRSSTVWPTVARSPVPSARRSTSSVSCWPPPAYTSPASLSGRSPRARGSCGGSPVPVWSPWG